MFLWELRTQVAKNIRNIDGEDSDEDGKKGKKSKGTVVSLQSFLSNCDVPVGTTQVAKNIRNIDGEDSDEGGNVLTVVCQLPTAPRANRIFDDNAIPYKSPFIAYVTNLPFDISEEDIYEYFNTNNVRSVRLPRDEGDTGRVRGFGYVEFENRDDLIQSLSIRDPTIKGRRIRIDLSNENEQSSRQRGSKRGYDLSATNVEGKDLSNWRRDNNTKRDSHNFGVERNFRDQKYTSDENNSPGSWRMKNRGTFTISSSVEQLHQTDQNEYHVHKNNTLERPKLILKPRTLPLPELDVPIQITLDSKTNDTNSNKYSGTSAEKVFGSAKPVDTTARDIEIEKRLANVRRQDNLQKDIIKTTNDFKELSFVKDERAKSINWRRQNEDEETLKSQDRKILKTDGRLEYVKENRKKGQGKSEGFRSDSLTNKDGKQRESIKPKPEFKINRHMENNVLNQNEFTVSANKYSGLDDDSDGCHA